MALTNALLKSFGIEQEQRDQIMTAHQETLEAIKAERDELRDKAAMVPDLERQIEELSAKSEEDWQAKYDEEHKAFEEYREEVAKEHDAAQKRELYRSLLCDAGVDEKRVDAILKVTDLDSMAMKDGKLADAKALAEQAKAEWADFITEKKTQGAQVENPPANSQSAFESMSLADKMKYANENPGDAAVKAWLGK